MEQRFASELPTSAYMGESSKRAREQESKSKGESGGDRGGDRDRATHTRTHEYAAAAAAIPIAASNADDDRNGNHIRTSAVVDASGVFSVHKGNHSPILKCNRGVKELVTSKVCRVWIQSCVPSRGTLPCHLNTA